MTQLLNPTCDNSMTIPLWVFIVRRFLGSADCRRTFFFDGSPWLRMILSLLADESRGLFGHIQCDADRWRQRPPQAAHRSEATALVRRAGQTTRSSLLALA